MPPPPLHRADNVRLMDHMRHLLSLGVLCSHGSAWEPSPCRAPNYAAAEAIRSLLYFEGSVAPERLRPFGGLIRSIKSPKPSNHFALSSSDH
jgi:hypothetical protein